MGNISDRLFAPFYGTMAENLLSFNVGRHPLYKQFRYWHFNKVRGKNNTDTLVLLNPCGESSFSLKIEPGKDFHRHSLFYGGVYERHITALIYSLLPSQDIFIDVGACIGYYTIMAASFKPDMRILSAEPDPESYDILKQNIVLNNAPHIEALNCAAGSENMQGILYKNDFPEQNALIPNKGEKINISVRKMDDLLTVVNKTILVKIDTEGYEFEVIKGMEKLIQNNRCTLIFEFNPKLYRLFGFNYAHSFLATLKAYGYALVFYHSGRKICRIEETKRFLKKINNKQTHILAKKI